MPYGKLTMYHFESSIRYSECDYNLNLKLSGLVNYFQDASTFHSESLGIGMDYLRSRHTAWVVSYWNIVIERYPRLGEKVRISTWPYNSKGFMASRNFTMHSLDGQLLAYADSIWAYLNLEKSRLQRLDPKQVELYELSDPFPMEPTSRKFNLPENMSVDSPIPVPKFFIDSNGHVNNEKYIEIALEFLPSDCQIKNVRVLYKKEAHLGDILYPYIDTNDSKATILLGNQNQEPYVILEFTLV